MENSDFSLPEYGENAIIRLSENSKKSALDRYCKNNV